MRGLISHEKGIWHRLTPRNVVCLPTSTGISQHQWSPKGPKMQAQSSSILWDQRFYMIHSYAMVEKQGFKLSKAGFWGILPVHVEIEEAKEGYQIWCWAEISTNDHWLMVVNPPVSLGGFHHLKPPCQIEVSNPNPTEIVMNTIFSVSFWGSICLAQHSQTSARNDLCRNWSSRLLSPVAMVGNKWKYGNMAWDEVWVSYIWKDVCHNSQSWLATAFYCMRHWVSRCRLCFPHEDF